MFEFNERETRLSTEHVVISGTSLMRRSLVVRIACLLARNDDDWPVSQDYRPTIFYPQRAAKTTFYGSLAEQCELQHIPFLSYMPSESHLITSGYNLIVDALFGCGFVGPTPELDMAAVIHTMIKSGVPIASIDVPSGQYAHAYSANVYKATDG